MYSDEYDSMPVTEEMGEIYKIVFSMNKNMRTIENNLAYLLHSKSRMYLELYELKEKIKKLENATKNFKPKKVWDD